jgi:hypothetical protein
LSELGYYIKEDDHYYLLGHTREVISEVEEEEVVFGFPVCKVCLPKLRKGFIPEFSMKEMNFGNVLGTMQVSEHGMVKRERSVILGNNLSPNHRKNGFDGCKNTEQ